MIRVLVAEDMRVLRDTLMSVLDLEEDLEVIAALGSGDEILPTALKQAPDVALIDIDLPVVDGLTAAAQLHEAVPACRVLILTGLSSATQFRRAVSAHASGFLHKDTPAEDVITAIRQVAAGGSAFDAEFAVAALKSAVSPLSERETDILRRFAAGASAEDIAGEVFLSRGTVRNYLASAVTKLDARNRVDAVRIARDAGWL